MTDTDRLAALLHEMSPLDTYGQHHYDCSTLARRLTAAGVTLTQPDAALREALDNAAADHEDHALRFTFDEGDEDHPARGALLLCETCADEGDRPLIVLRDWDAALRSTPAAPQPDHEAWCRRAHVGHCVDGPATPAATRDPIRVMLDGSADASDMMPGPEQPKPTYIDGLREALETALNQWRAYADEHPDRLNGEWDPIGESTDGGDEEAAMFRACIAALRSTPAAPGLPWADGPCPECGRSDEHAAPCHAQTTLRCPHVAEDSPCGERGHEGCCRSDPAAPLREALDIIKSINGCHGCLDNGSDEDRATVARLRAALATPKEAERERL